MDAEPEDREDYRCGGLTLTSSNWETAQTITVMAAADGRVDGTQTRTVEFWERHYLLGDVVKERLLGSKDVGP